MRHIDKLFAADNRLMRAAREFARVIADPSQSMHVIDNYRDQLRVAAEEFGRCAVAVTRGSHDRG